MPNPVVFLGSVSSHGGAMITATGANVLASGMPSCRSGDLHTCPIQYHGVTPIISTSTVLDNGVPIARVGDMTGCGATLVTGAFTVLVD